MTWHLGVATGACIDQPVLDMLDHLGTVDVRGIEIGTAPRHFAFDDQNAVRAVKRRLATLGRPVVSTHAPFGPALDLASPDARHRRAGIDAVLAAATTLANLGGRIVVVHPTDLPRQGADVDARLADAAASLTEVAAGCAHAQVVLAVETPLPHLIGGHPDEFVHILRGLPEGVGVCLDTGHIALGQAWDRFVDVVGHAVVHVHAHDNHGQADEHLPPGDGSIDWTAVHGRLAGLDGREGWIMLELACPTTPMAPYVQRAVAQARARLPVGCGTHA